METLARDEVVKTLTASQVYQHQLEQLLISVKEAQEQVNNSSSIAYAKINQTFSSFKDSLLKSLEERKLQLLKSVSVHEDEATKPLRQCRDDIVTLLNNNQATIDCANQILKCGGCKSPGIAADLVSRATKLGSLPEVPDLDNVARITFEADNIPNPDVEALIRSTGKVYSIAPVQIVDICPKRGALRITWDDVCPEGQACLFMNQTYRLQAASCDANTVGSIGLDSFHDVYIGSEFGYLLRSVNTGETYSFRVCCKLSRGWSSWSLIKTAKTVEEPYSWDSKNTDFVLSDNDKLVRAINFGSLIFSSGAQVASGCSLQFTYLSTAAPLCEEGVGLYVAAESNNNPGCRKDGELFVSFCGDVYIDGKKKIITLPKMARNSHVIFDCQRLGQRWRIQIESGDKVVTYEWNISVEHLYFGASLSRPDIQILVE